MLFYSEIVESPCGSLKIVACDKYITFIDFFKGDIAHIVKYLNKSGKGAVLSADGNVLTRSCAEQLNEYFQGNRKAFDLPIKLYGTDFQVKCWEALLAIPYGQTRSYAEQANVINSPMAFRAVGQANHNNPISIIVPCHRVIGSDKKLVGYGGSLPVKEYLLKLEHNSSN